MWCDIFWKQIANRWQKNYQTSEEFVIHDDKESVGNCDWECILEMEKKDGHCLVEKVLMDRVVETGEGRDLSEYSADLEIDWDDNIQRVRYEPFPHVVRYDCV